MILVGRGRVFEVAVEVAIAVALVISISAYAIYGPKDSSVSDKWIAFGVNTVFVFGYALKLVRPLWATPKLWAVIAGVAFAHGIVGWYVISRFERVPLLCYVPVDVVEIWVVLKATEAFTSNEIKQSPHAHQR